MRATRRIVLWVGLTVTIALGATPTSAHRQVERNDVRSTPKKLELKRAVLQHTAKHVTIRTVAARRFGSRYLRKQRHYRFYLRSREDVVIEASWRKGRLRAGRVKAVLRNGKYVHRWVEPVKVTRPDRRSLKIKLNRERLEKLVGGLHAGYVRWRVCTWEQRRPWFFNDSCVPRANPTSHKL